MKESGWHDLPISAPWQSGNFSSCDSAATLEFLRSPPGNRLEALRGDREGQHSIRINDQWRVCFIWTEDGPKSVEIVDYH
jgi:proteic killer suppression protein